MVIFPVESFQPFRDAVEAASRRADVHDAVGNIYRALQDQIELRRPICRTSGRCCRFGEFAHRLFVTTMELATFLHNLQPQAVAGLPQRADRCPFQQQRLCTVHAIRPFGCRIFFCDETSSDWQCRQYEFFHAEIKRLHECLAVPYFYVEWLQAIQVAYPIVTRNVPIGPAGANVPRRSAT